MHTLLWADINGEPILYTWRPLTSRKIFPYNRHLDAQSAGKGGKGLCVNFDLT